MSSPAADDTGSSTASDGVSSVEGHQEAGPAHVESSKTWAIPTANFKPKPHPQQGDSSKSSNPPKNHIHIPKIAPMSSNPEPSKLAVGLEGKYVDEFGNILDWDGSVLGRVEGDLPSMIGRPVSKSGEILDVDGEVVGYVAENHTKPTLSALGGGLKVDSSGNIYNADNEIVGKLNDTPGGERLKPSGSGGSGSGSGDLADKPSATPGPSEIYLDVKSTHDGIQLIIKIPTVFKNEQDKQ
jgi:hypothetical protein